MGNKNHDAVPRRDSFLGEVLKELRPYLMALMIDFVISVCLWLCLYVFQWLTTVFPIHGFKGVTVIAVHAASTTLAFATFGLKFTYDVIVISRRSSR
jgi:hypothetical protein